MKHISSHMNESAKNKGRATERGELLQYFMKKLNIARGKDGLPALTMARMGKTLQAIPTEDLYYLKSVCDESDKRGGISAFSKKFWWEVNPKKHTEGQP